MVNFKRKGKNLGFKLIFCLIVFSLSGCDTIYTKKSKPLLIKASASISNYLRVEGVSSVFPDLKKVFINTKNNTVLKSEILVIIFYDEKYLEILKNKINQESQKSIADLKQKIDPKTANYTVIKKTAVLPYTLTLSNITIFKEGLWIVFYSETDQNLETSLEFKRIGVSEIPKTSIMSI